MNTLYVGYTDNYLKIVFEGSEELIGKLVKVKITKAGYPYNEAQFVRVLEDDVKRNQQAHKVNFNERGIHSRSLLARTIGIKACKRKRFACFLLVEKLSTENVRNE